MMSMFSLTLLGFYSPFWDWARACTSHAGVYSTLFSGSGLVGWVSTEAQSKASNEEKWFLWEVIPESTVGEWKSEEGKEAGRGRKNSEGMLWSRALVWPA